MAHLGLRISVVLAILLLVQTATAQIKFTGDVAKDFSNIGSPRNRTLLQVPNYNPVSTSLWMKNHSQLSGFDIKGTSLQYDYRNDTLYVGWDCWVICGDADGDGNPAFSSDRGNNWTTNSPPSSSYSDFALQATTESIAMTIWTKTPANFVGSNSFAGYFPDVVVGDSYSSNLGNFNAYEFKTFAACQEDGYTNYNQCLAYIVSRNNNPGNYFGLRIWDLSQSGANGWRSVPSVKLFQYPNATYPDMEFTMGNFSRYGNFSFRPGIDKVTFAFALVAGSSRDSCGEEVQYPQVLTMPCLIEDSCGVCNGDNTSCMDCDHIPNGPKRYDACGVCNGNNKTCWDCDHIPNGPKRYDACGVCNGDNKTCWDCDHIPNGPKKYDACGVCDGKNTTCMDCDHIPNGPKKYDACGVCNGKNTTCMDCDHIPNGIKQYDACGVCDGNNKTCWDCDHIPNGKKKYDACGVCDGKNTTCMDCDHIPNGHKLYDACGVCDGNNKTCWDCDHIPNGNKAYDECGVCGGNNQTCWDCDHVPNGVKQYDECGICGGNNQTCWGCDRVPNSGLVYDECGLCGGDNHTCWDCFSIPNGPAKYDACGVCDGKNTTCWDCERIPGGNKTYDECGICGGDNTTCMDCAHIPNGPYVYDLCGVCGGHNDECECWIYKNITLIAKDTYVALEKRNENFGNDIDLVVSSNKERTLLRFDDLRFSVIGATEQRPIIMSAKLRLFIRGVVKLPQQGFEDSKLVLHNLDNNFCEEKATWECRDIDETGCCVEWRMLALYPKIKADYAWEETQSIDVKNFDQGWIEFDVLDDIINFIEHSFMNSKSYLIKKGCEKDFGWIRFWSSNSQKQFNAPHLYIEIKARCAPPKPVLPDPCPELEDGDKKRN